MFPASKIVISDGFSGVMDDGAGINRAGRCGRLVALCEEIQGETTYFNKK